MKSAIACFVSSLLLISIYPKFYMPLFGKLGISIILICALYVLSSFLKDWPSTFEQDAFFRLLKKNLNNDKSLYGSLLKINAFVYSAGIIINLLGIAAGWVVMSLSPVGGLIIAWPAPQARSRNCFIRITGRITPCRSPSARPLFIPVKTS